MKKTVEGTERRNLIRESKKRMRIIQDQARRRRDELKAKK